MTITKNNLIGKDNKDHSVLFDGYTFIITFLSVLLIHGEMIFNKLSWHDDVGCLYYGFRDGLAHGRWFYYIMENWMNNHVGEESIPFFNGGISALCIAVMACVIFYIFDIHNKAVRTGLALVFAGIPAVTGNFGYMVTSGFNFVGMLFAVAGGFVLFLKTDSRKLRILFFVIASVLFAFSLGEYQCYFAFYLSLILLYLIKQCVSEDMSFRRFFLTGIKCITSAALGLGIYLLILQGYIASGMAQLTSYAGTDTYGIVSLQEYAHRIVYAYKAFLKPSIEGYANMFPMHKAGWYIVLLAVIAIAGLSAFILSLRQKKYIKALEMVIACVLVPAAMNFDFILYGIPIDFSTGGVVHSLHMYHLVLLFVLPFILCSGVWNESKTVGGRMMFCRILVIASSVMVFAWGILYVRYDNYCYMVNEVRQAKAISYFTTLITRIESVKGYNPEYPVAFINEDSKINNVDDVSSQYDYPVTNPYWFPVVNSYDWHAYIGTWCGYWPAYADPAAFADNKEVKVMPSYPYDGSIKIIDGTVVVKF